MSTYITNVNGQNEEAEGIETGGTVDDAHKLVQTGADGRFHESLLPAGVGAEVAMGTAGETLVAANLVAFDSAGEVVRASAAAGGRDAIGFVKAGHADGETDVTVYLDGPLDGLTGLTPGARYYLSETPGQVTAVPVTTSGARLQFVGTAVSATTLKFSPDDSIKRL